ncbi:MAG: hypothetical protein R3B40_09335 [Polyangiales bacterium]
MSQRTNLGSVARSGMWLTWMALVVVGCGGGGGGPTDAGMGDTGMGDTGMSDTGMNDTGMNDTGMSDAGMNDAGQDMGCADTDGDGVCDDVDVCSGDDATGDTDTDGVCDDTDVCTGDDASGDTDTDGICDDTDTCRGDNTTGDADIDGVCDDLDACSGDDASGDTDTDGICDDTDTCRGDNTTGDTDADGVCNDLDMCSGDDASGDTDSDGVCDDIDVCSGDDASGDTDSDGVCNDIDACDGDDASGDTDSDGVCDDIDNCVPIFNPDQADVVEPIGEGDACNVVFVREGATGAGDGTSWTDAFTNVQSAVTAAQADVPTGPLKEIWIAEGSYRGESNTTVLTTVTGLQVYGGFAGTEVQRSARPSPLRVSRISGDANGDDEPLTVAVVAATRNAPDQPTRADNAALVVSVVSDVRLDGITVSDGYTEVVQDGVGIRIANSATGVVLANVTVENNVGAVFNASGAGAYLGTNATATFTGCSFVGNIAWNGAGLLTSTGTTLTISDASFEGNGTIGGQGTGLLTRGATTLTDAVFLDNEMVGNGGGALFSGSGGGFTALNVLLDGNIGRRGAMQLGGTGTHTFTNITIANTVSTGSEGAVWATSAVSFVNAVFWNNGAGDLNANGMNQPGSVTHSCAPTDFSALGTGNVLLDGSTAALDDPFNVGPARQLFLNHTAAGQAATSACVDAGDTTNDPNVYFPDWFLRTTRSDGALDGSGPDAIDMGYHYPASGAL